MPRAVVRQPALVELRRALHERIGRLAEELAVEREPVMLPEMPAEPASRHRPERKVRFAIHRVGATPYRSVVMHYPTGAMVHPARDATAGHRHLSQELEERLAALGKICDLRGPVIH